MPRQYLSKGGGIRGSNANSTHIILNVIKGEHNALKKNIDNLQNVDTDIRSYLDSQDNRIAALERKVLTLENAITNIQKVNSETSKQLNKPKPKPNSARLQALEELESTIAET